MNGMEGIFGIIGIGAGLYSLYAWFQLKFKGIINTSILVPKDTNIKKCKDKEAYRAKETEASCACGSADLVRRRRSV